VRAIAFRGSVLGSLAIGLVASAWLASGSVRAASGGQTLIVRRTWRAARHSRCDRPRPSVFAYRWPVKPFDVQHPIRGNFGDPRTISSSALGADVPSTSGSFTFHNGVDISVPDGTPVYPVASGTASVGYGDEVIVRTGDFRTFQYFHIKPEVRPGQHVVAYRTVLGRVNPQWLHVHLSELDGFQIHNPVDPGHLEPYRDHTIPSVQSLDLSNPSGTSVDPLSLHGKFLIAAEASDLPSIPVPGLWLNFPVTPALVSWKMADASGATIVPPTTVVDFRRTQPPNRDFWRVYAPGTYQNFPDFGRHKYFGLPGRYLFNLTPQPLDTRRVPNGFYDLTVGVADVCGNRGTLTERLRVQNGRPAH